MTLAVGDNPAVSNDDLRRTRNPIGGSESELDELA
jgi:hypothetical protein